MFGDASDPNPPFGTDHLDEVLHTVKTRVWRRRALALVPTVVVAGAGYLLVGSLVTTTLPVTATSEAGDVAAAAVDENDGRVDIDGPNVVSPPPPSLDEPVSAAGGTTTSLLELDPAKVTVLTQPDPVSDVTTEATETSDDAPVSTGAATESASAVASTTPSVAASIGEQRQPDVDVTDPSFDGSVDEPTGAATQAESPAIASDPDDDGVVPLEDPDAAPAPDPTNGTTGTTATGSAETDPAPPVTDAAVLEGETVPGDNPSSSAEAATTDAIGETVPPAPTENSPVTVEFGAMVIDGSTVTLTLHVTDLDGYSVGACGTTMVWGDGTTSVTMCPAGQCLTDAPEGIPAGISGDLTFSHTYGAITETVVPIFTIYTGYECYGDAFFGQLSPSLTVEPAGVSITP